MSNPNPAPEQSPRLRTLTVHIDGPAATVHAAITRQENEGWRVRLMVPGATEITEYRGSSVERVIEWWVTYER